MYRDTSEIRDTGCNVLNATDQITNYYGNSRIQYTLIGNKYKKYSQTTSSYNYDTSSYVCYTKSDIEQLQSNYDYIMPVYETMAIGLSLVVIYYAYKIILHPWWRPKP